MIEKLGASAPALSEKTEPVLLVGETGIDDQIKLANLKIRQNVSFWIMALFGVVNLFILGLIVWLAVVDQQELAAKLTGAGDRLVDTRVLISLLGATTVQLGTVAVIMARSVFKD